MRDHVPAASYIDEHVLVKRFTGPAAGEYYYLLKELYSVAGLADANGRQELLLNYGSAE